MIFLYSTFVFLLLYSVEDTCKCTSTCIVVTLGQTTNSGCNKSGSLLTQVQTHAMEALEHINLAIIIIIEGGLLIHSFYYIINKTR